MSCTDIRVAKFRIASKLHVSSRWIYSVSGSTLKTGVFIFVHRSCVEPCHEQNCSVLTAQMYAIIKLKNRNNKRFTVEPPYNERPKGGFVTYRDSFSYISLLLGRGVPFVIPRSSLHRGSLYRCSTVNSFVKSLIIYESYD